VLYVFHIVTVFCVSVCPSVCLCVGHTGELCKMAEHVEMPFGGYDSNRVLDGVKIGRIHSQPQGVTSWRCGLLPNYYGLVFHL